MVDINGDTVKLGVFSPWMRATDKGLSVLDCVIR